MARKDERGKCFQIVLHAALISQEVRGMEMEADREVNGSDFISASVHCLTCADTEQEL